MELEQKLKMLQIYYAAALSDSTLRYGRAKILEEVTEQKRKEQMSNGIALAERFRIKEQKDVFYRTAEIYGCADWVCEATEDGYIATATSCLLCTISKNMNNPFSPCKLHCLSPIEAMLKGIAKGAEFAVEETLWNGNRCRVKVTLTK